MLAPPTSASAASACWVGGGCRRSGTAAAGVETQEHTAATPRSFHFLSGRLIPASLSRPRHVTGVKEADGGGGASSLYTPNGFEKVHRHSNASFRVIISTLEDFLQLWYRHCALSAKKTCRNLQIARKRIQQVQSGSVAREGSVGGEGVCWAPPRKHAACVLELPSVGPRCCPVPLARGGPPGYNFLLRHYWH